MMIAQKRPASQVAADRNFTGEDHDGEKPKSMYHYYFVFDV